MKSPRMQAKYRISIKTQNERLNHNYVRRFCFHTKIHYQHVKVGVNEKGKNGATNSE